MNYKGNFRTIQAIKASEDGSLPSEIQVLPVGEWNTLPYGPFKVTTEHLRQMIANFHLGTRRAVPVDVDHDGGKAAGWINNLVARDDGLYADVEWTPYGQELLQGKIYKLFSPEFSLNYVDPEYSTDHGAVFIAGSLTNRPLFKELSYITASEKPLAGGSEVVLLFSQDTMNLEELKTKNKEDLTPEEVTFLKDHSAELTDEEKANLGLVEEQPTEEPKEPTEPEPKQEEPKVEQPTNPEPEPQPEVTASEGQTVTISASELESMKALAEEGRKAKEELVVKAANDRIEAFVCDDKGGKILPKDKQAFVDFYLKCTDEQKAGLEKLLELIPDKKIAGEIGKNEPADEREPVEAILKLSDEIMASDKVDRAASYDVIREKHPEVWKQYKEFNGDK